MNHRTLMTFALAAVFAGFTATRLSAQPPPSPDLTGTWVGGYSCHWLEDGVPDFVSLDNTLMITHASDADVRMKIVPDEVTYSGLAVGWVGEPSKAAATLVECRTAPGSAVYNETCSIRFDTATGELRGRCAFNRDLTLVGGACSLNYTRTDAADPLVPACPTE